jgi:spore coat polysaccharide biosynthesis protein SpsF
MTKPKVGIVVFARCDSTRLPQKVLRPIAGVPMLEHVLDRLRRAAGDVLAVATTERRVDDPVVEFAKSQAVTVFRGDTDDVLKRARDCAQALGLDHLVRISGDSPFMEPAVVTRAVEIHLAEEPDLTTNVDPRTFPFGCSVEVISAAALSRALNEATVFGDREHVTKPIYAARQRYKIRNFTADNPAYEGVRLVVDTAEDLARAEWIAHRAQPSRVDAPLDQIVSLARAWSVSTEAMAKDGVRAS